MAYTIQTRFGPGDTVFVVILRRESIWKDCETCEAKGFVSLAVDPSRTVYCPDCEASGQRLVKSDIQTYEVEEMVVGQVRAQRHDRPYTAMDETRYMLDQTGIGSGMLWSQNDLHASEVDAANFAEAQGAVHREEARS